MPGLVINGIEVPVPGRVVVNWNDDKLVRLAIGEDGKKRPPALWWSGIRQIILHTTKGIPGARDPRPQDIRDGAGPKTWGRLNVARMWRDDDKYSGAHLVVDHDATIYCLADLRREVAYHATTANDVSIGIEMKQGSAAELYEDQLNATADLVDTLTSYFGIQRQMPRFYRGRPLQRMNEDAGQGRTCWGVFGHRDQTARKGAGDPGDTIFDVLERRGYERFDFEREEDRDVWRGRQRSMGLSADGYPGKGTTDMLRARGFAHGLYVLPPTSAVG